LKQEFNLKKFEDGKRIILHAQQGRFEKSSPNGGRRNPKNRNDTYRQYQPGRGQANPKRSGKISGYIGHQSDQLEEKGYGAIFPDRTVGFLFQKGIVGAGS